MRPLQRKGSQMLDTLSYIGGLGWWVTALMALGIEIAIQVTKRNAYRRLK